MFIKNIKVLKKHSYIFLAFSSIALTSDVNANYFDTPEEAEAKKVAKLNYELAQKAWEELKMEGKNPQKAVVQTSFYTPEKCEDIVNTLDLKRKNIFR